MCLTLCLPGSSVHGILKARIPESVAVPSSRDLPDLGIKPMSLMSPSLADGFFTSDTWEAQMDTYTLLYLKWITNKDLLYRTLCGCLDGRAVWGRMDTCICMAESLRCSPKTIKTLLISYIPIQNKKFLKSHFLP